MRVLLITVGSRGDAEPFCALAQALAKAGHNADLWLQQDQCHLAPSSSNDKVDVRELPFTCMDFYKFVGNPKPEHDHPNPRVKFTGVVCDICGELVLPCTQQVLEACADDDKVPTVIVASSLARHLAMAVSAKLQVQLCLVQLQSLIPTQDFPHFSHVDDCVEAIVTKKANKDNVETFLELERFQYKFIKEKWEEVYQELDVPFPTINDIEAVLQGKHDDIVMVNACGNQVIPDCSDCRGDNIWNVGALADDYLPQDYEPPQELVDFLTQEETKPICIGYGSMPFDKTQLLEEALKQTNERAVLVGSAMMNVETNGNIFTVESVPYSYLLPQCSMMLSHGGAGVVHATLRAGIPSVISPLLGDQFLWAKLLKAKGLGVASGSLPELTVETLVESIESAKACTEACEKVGMAIREQEPGAKQMVRLLEEQFG